MKCLPIQKKQGWKEDKLSSFITDFIVPQRDKPKLFGGDIPWCRIEDFNGIYLTDSKSKLSVNKEIIQKMGLRVYPTNTILVSCSADLGRCAIVGRPLVTNQTFIGLVPSDRVDPLFLYYYMTNLAPVLNEMASGATIKYLSKKKFQDLRICFPKILEQQRIVGILDETFDGIATAKANAEKNLQNSRVLFESYLQSVFTKRGEGWVDRTLDQVCVVERGSSPRPIKKYFTTAPTGVNWIKIGDTEEGGKFVYSTAQKITPDGAKQSRFVKEGDFILTNSMSFGRPYIMKTSGYIHDGWFVLRLNASIDADYFYYLLSSRFVQSQFAQLASGSVVKNISSDLVKKAVLPIPPLAHQHVIVKKLLEISAETQRLESIYQSKLIALDELKKSLMDQAFTGAL